MSAGDGPGGFSANHESLCRRCGLSCHFAIPVNGLPVVVPGLACRFLVRDADGRHRCAVYERRFDVAPWCRTVEQSIEGRLLAQDCPYVAGRPGYRGKVVLHQRLFSQVAPALRRHIVELGVPPAVDPAGVLPVLEEDGSRWRVCRDEPDGPWRFRPRESVREREGQQVEPEARPAGPPEEA